MKKSYLKGVEGGRGVLWDGVMGKELWMTKKLMVNRKKYWWFQELNLNIGKNSVVCSKNNEIYESQNCNQSEFGVESNPTLIRPYILIPKMWSTFKSRDSNHSLLSASPRKSFGATAQVTLVTLVTSDTSHMGLPSPDISCYGFGVG